MKNRILVTLICTTLLIGLFSAVQFGLNEREKKQQALKIGFLYVGDESTPYTNNFLKAEENVKNTFGDKIQVYQKENVAEGYEDESLQELIDEGCELIFSTSYGYKYTVKEFAEKYPEIEFVQATGDNGAEEPILSNYHTCMGHIYEGRYVAGVVAGMKLQELLDNGITTDAKVGYVGAFAIPEVRSGYTAFILGVRSVVPDATMTVKYADSWSDYGKEKALATELINEGCVIISQHSDTVGPAAACEQFENVYHVGYNQSMISVAPTSSLISCRINWTPYIEGAINARLKGRKIESNSLGTVNGTDVGAGFERDWVEMLELNHNIAASGTEEVIQQTVKNMKNGEITVFSGDYVGVNPENPSDKIQLSDGFIENEFQSAPSFNYVLENVVVEE